VVDFLVVSFLGEMALYLDLKICNVHSSWHVTFLTVPLLSRMKKDLTFEEIMTFPATVVRGMSYLVLVDWSKLVAKLDTTEQERLRLNNLSLKALQYFVFMHTMSKSPPTGLIYVSISICIFWSSLPRFQQYFVVSELITFAPMYFVVIAFMLMPFSLVPSLFYHVVVLCFLLRLILSRDFPQIIFPT
jgi:hypothetical protein